MSRSRHNASNLASGCSEIFRCTVELIPFTKSLPSWCHCSRRLVFSIFLRHSKRILCWYGNMTCKVGNPSQSTQCRTASHRESRGRPCSRSRKRATGSWKSGSYYVDKAAYGFDNRVTSSWTCNYWSGVGDSVKQISQLEYNTINWANITARCRNDDFGPGTCSFANRCFRSVISRGYTFLGSNHMLLQLWQKIRFPFKIKQEVASSGARKYIYFEHASAWPPNLVKICHT